MQKWRVFAVIVTLLFAFNSMVSAFSVGPIKVTSHLGENFKAEIPIEMLNEESPEKLAVAVGTDQDYQLLKSDRAGTITNLKASVVPGKAGAKILVQSDRPVNESSFDLVISATLDQGTILKKFIVSLLTKISPVRSPNITNNLMARTAVPASTKISKIYGPVHPGETLLQIAKKISTADQDMERVAVALWKGNRQAFVRENIHGLRYDAKLNLQGLDNAMATLTVEEAKRMLDSQWEEWISWRDKAARKEGVVKKPEPPKGAARKPSGISKERLSSQAASGRAEPQPKSVEKATGSEGAISTPQALVKPDSLMTKEHQAASPPPGRVEASAKTVLANQGTGQHAPQPGGTVEQPISTAMPIGAVTQNIDTTIEALKEQLSKIKKELLMLKSRLFEVEGQSQTLRQQLTYLFYFTIGENILLALLILVYYIRRRKSGERIAEEVERDTLWLKK